MFERIGNAEARAEYKQIKKAEKLYLGAVEKAGYAYINRKIISYRPDEELDKIEKIQYAFKGKRVASYINNQENFKSWYTTCFKVYADLEQKGLATREDYKMY